MSEMPISLYMICERLSSRLYMTRLVSIVEPRVSANVMRGIIQHLYIYYNRIRLLKGILSFVTLNPLIPLLFLAVLGSLHFHYSVIFDLAEKDREQ